MAVESALAQLWKTWRRKKAATELPPSCCGWKKSCVLLQFDAAGHGRVLLGEDALALGEHFLAVLNTEGEVREPARQRDRDVSAAAAHVDHCAP